MENKVLITKQQIMKKFNYIKDAQGRESYEDWIQRSIDNTVQTYLNKLGETYDLNEIKTIFDIGSMNAIEAYKFTEKLPNCITHSFEPSEFNIGVCNQVKEDNNRMNIHQLALSDYNGKSTFYMAPENIGAHSLLKPMDLHKTGGGIYEIEVEVSRGDDWCKLNNIKKIDLIWMDVQGNELNVLKGFGDMMHNIKGIYTEAGRTAYYEGHTMRDDIIAYCESYGLKFVWEWVHDGYEGDLMFIRE